MVGASSASKLSLTKPTGSNRLSGVTVNGRKGSLPGFTVTVRLKTPGGVSGSVGVGDCEPKLIG